MKTTFATILMFLLLSSCGKVDSWTDRMYANLSAAYNKAIGDIAADGLLRLLNWTIDFDKIMYGDRVTRKIKITNSADKVVSVEVDGSGLIKPISIVSHSCEQILPHDYCEIEIEVDGTQIFQGMKIEQPLYLNKLKVTIKAEIVPQN